MGSHPKANHIIVAHIGGEQYKSYVSHFELVHDDVLHRSGPAWKLKFYYFISKKREKGIIAGYERNPNDPFRIEILPAYPNKYQKHATYCGKAKFNEVVEKKDLIPTEAYFVLDIVGAPSVDATIIE